MKLTRLKNLVDYLGPLQITVLAGLLFALGRLITRAGLRNEGPLVQDVWFMAPLGVAALVILFIAALALARFVLGFGPGPFGVAKTVLDEAIRMRVALVFMVLLLVTIPVLPLALGEDEPLRYRVQTFLSYGLIATSVLLSLMTIFLSCGTLANEIRDKQIYTITTKPIGRATYIIGKWLGISVLNAVLLIVAAAAIYGFSVLYLANQPAKDAYDEIALREQVLVARVSEDPQEPEELQQIIEQRYQTMLQQSPEMVDRAGGEEAARRQVRQQVVAGWLSVGPLETERYLFTGLEPVAQRWQAVLNEYNAAVQQAQAEGSEAPPPPPRQYIQMRYKMEVSSDIGTDKITLLFAFNQQVQPIEMVAGMAQVVPIPVDYISPDGQLEILVRNPDENYPTILLDAKAGLQLLYKVDDFTSNYLRAVAAMWVKLAFLAMLGLMAASFLGFPVAALLSLLIYGAASISPYLIDSAQSFGAKPANVVESIFNVILRNIAYYTAVILEKFAEFSPISEIVDGLLFSWGELIGCIIWVGVIWTGLAAVIATLVFRNRELARVQV